MRSNNLMDQVMCQVMIQVLHSCRAFSSSHWRERAAAQPGSLSDSSSSRAASVSAADCSAALPGTRVRVAVTKHTCRQQWAVVACEQT